MKGDAVVVRTAAAVQKAIAIGSRSGSILATNYTSPNAETTANITIKLTGQSDAIGDLTGRGLVVEMLN